MQVEFKNASIKHYKGERRARSIKGEERKMIRANLSKIQPSTLRNKGLLNMSAQQYISGNRDGVGASPSVFQKMSSEAKKIASIG